MSEVHPDEELKVAASLIRNQASRDYSFEQIQMLKLAAIICEFISEGESNKNEHSR